MSGRSAILAMILAVGSGASVEGQIRHPRPPRRATYPSADINIGPRISLGAEALGMGAQVGIPVMNRLELSPSFEYIAVDGGSLWEVNADFKYRLFQERLEWMYAGAGFNLHQFRFAAGGHDSEVRLNAFAGAESPRGRVRPFSEIRAGIGNRGFVVIASGLRFGFQ